MKRPVRKIAALGLCAALTAGAMGGAACARAAGEEFSAAPATVRTLASVGGTAVPFKDETVYILTGADGAVQKVIVSDWLKNPTGSAVLRDATGLTSVENVKGSETYSLDGGVLVWDAQGSDIYCQGSIDKDLPVDMAVSYKLDGRSVSPEELAGKSGKVVIRFDYTNHQFETAEIAGKPEKIYVPFAMLTGIVLDNEIFTNVELSSGRLYSDGNRTIVAGLAFPGLAESLNIDSDKLEIPSYVEITADVQNFELSNMVTIAVSDLFGELDTSTLNSADDLQDSLDELTNAMDQLMDGSSQLCGGLNQLVDQSGQLVSGINQLAEGTDALKTGASDLISGAKTLQSGTSALVQGAQALEDGTSELSAGAASLKSGAESLQTGLAALTTSSGQLNDGAEQIFTSLLSTASAQLTAAGLELPPLTAENYATILDSVIAATPQGAEPIAAVKASLDSYNSFYQGLRRYTAGVAEAAEHTEQLALGAAGLSAGVEQLKDGAANLASGTGQVDTGAAALAVGTEQLSSGISQAADGVNLLKDGAPALVEGVVQLRDGAQRLSDGLEEFNREGIQKLVDAVDGDLSGLMERLEATADAARGYQSFSGVDSQAGGQVKFVYRTEAIALAE